MGEIIYDVVLNVKYAGCRQQLNVTTGEVNARKLRIKLTNGAVPIKLNQYTDTAIMRGVKSDKKLIYNTAKITEEGNVEYTLGSQDTVSGKTWYEVQVLRKDGDVEPKIIYSAQFKVEVNNKLYDDGQVTSSNQFGTLEDTIEEARSWMDEKDADIDSRTLTCIEEFSYTEADNTTPTTKKDPSNENSGIIFTAPKIPVDFDYIKAKQIDTEQYVLHIQIFKGDECIKTVTVAGQQNVQIADVRGTTHIQVIVIGMAPNVDGNPKHFKLEKLKLFSSALEDVVDTVNKLQKNNGEDEELDFKKMGFVNGTLKSTDGTEVASTYYVRSDYLINNEDCYYTIECPAGKSVYCFTYDENKKYISYSNKQEGTYVYEVPGGNYVRFLFKYSNNTSSSGTAITSIDDFLKYCVITRSYKELEIDTSKNIYFYVNADDGSRVPCVLRLPLAYKSSGKATQLVMCAHGAGGTVVPATDTNQLTTWLGYVDNGYAIFDVHGASANMSKHWGNEAALHVYYRAYRHIIDNYNVDDLLVISGKSMGGLTAINFANYYPNICRCIAILYPVTDLYNQININDEMISNGNTASMLKAYGITSWTDGSKLPDAMVGYDPIHSRMVGDGILLQIPIKIWHGTADTYVDYTKSDTYISKIKKAGGHADYVPIKDIYHGNYDKNKVPLSNNNATGVVYENYWKTEVVEKELIPWVNNFIGNDCKQEETKQQIKITSQPASIDSAVGNVVSFSIEATGSTTLSYQWQVSKDNGVTWNNTSISGNTTAFISFVIPNEEYEGRMLRCIVIDNNGNIVESNAATITLNGAADVTVTTQPQNLTAKVGDSINIFVAAKSSKSNKLTYQWQVSSSGTWNNTSIAGNNTSALNFVVPNINYNGRMYRCRITDGNGSWVLSNAMTLTVTE